MDCIRPAPHDFKPAEGLATVTLASSNRLLLKGSNLCSSTSANNPIMILPEKTDQSNRTDITKPKKTSYDCDSCPQSFHSADMLQRRVQIHQASGLECSSQCPVCGKNFPSPRHVRSHIAIHQSDRPHHCQLCGRGFNSYANLIKHKRIHTGEKPYKCDMCGKAFAQSSNLNVHKGSHKQPKTPSLYLYS